MLTTTGSFLTERQGLSDARPRGWCCWAGRRTRTASSRRSRATRSAGCEPVQVNLSSVAVEPTSEIALNVNLPTETSRPARAATARAVTVEYFDNVGGSQTLTMSFTPDGAGGRRPAQQHLDADADRPGLGPVGRDATSSSSATRRRTPAGSTSVTALGRRRRWRRATTRPPATWCSTSATSRSPSASARPARRARSTCRSSPRPSRSVGVSHDGNAAGTFTGLSIDEKGYPVRHLLERLLQGDLPDPGRRRAEPERAEGARQPVLRPLAGLGRRCSSGTPATGRRAAIEGFAREQSTTDIANELTQLIQTQRAYSSNAKIIQTVDEMLQETTNLKR